MAFGSKTRRVNRQRLWADLSLLLAVFILPWWLTAILALIFLLRFSHFIEAMIAAGLLDIIYGGGAGWWGLSYPLTIGFAVLTLFVEGFIKERIRLYEASR